MRVTLSPAMSQWLERVLFTIGLICLCYYGYHVAEARSVQRRQAAALHAMLESAPIGPVTANATAVTARKALPDDVARVGGRAKRSAAANDVLALLEIPRLGLSSTVMSGDGEDVLDVAIGHLPDTPKPWEPGNSALAGHRDGLFRPLRNIRVGDELRVRAPEGEFVYRVRETKIVTPDDLSVLADTATPTLTLITCYPFNFIGHAPKRFIVRAERVD